MSEYPKFKYCADGNSKIVNNGTEEEALGKDWFDSPSEAKGKKPVPRSTAATKETAKRLEELEAELSKLAKENADLQKQLEEAEDHIETLEAALEEASKNDQRGEDGKFVSPDSDEKGEIVEIEASDAAIKLAEAAGVDLATVTGTGANGNITKGDVQAVIEARETESEAEEGESDETETEE